MTPLRIRAPAKVNWTLEVLGKRPDGYHEVRTILQTVDLSDWLTLTPARDVSLTITGDTGTLATEPVETNLAYRAAVALQRRIRERSLGAHIEIEKHVPIAAGLGGGSSDAAAVLRGMRAAWHLDIANDELSALAADLGSDVPFFLHGGTGLASDRGEHVEALPDAAPQRLLLAWPNTLPASAKTSRMYGTIASELYTDGSRTGRLAERFRGREVFRDEDLWNVFEQVAPALDLSTPTTHLCGSGPAVFLLLEPAQPLEPLRRTLEALGLATAEAQTLTAAEALAFEEPR